MSTSPEEEKMTTNTIIHLKDGREVEVPFKPDAVKHFVTEALEKGYAWINFDHYWVQSERISFLERVTR
jgi:hypothetical protein